MPDQRQHKNPNGKVQRVKLTARVSVDAYDAITELQRRHRRRTGKALWLWQILDAAIIAYAKRHGVEVGE